jgi:VWFA-related protein
MLRWIVVLGFCFSTAVSAQQSSAPTADGPAQNQTAPVQGPPELSHRPVPNASVPEGKIKLDVVVTDGAGVPVSGLQQKDFTLLDNKKPQPILSFRAVDGSTGNATAADPPVEVILLIDATNNSLTRVAYERTEIERFLRQNGGHLAQPVTLMIFAEQGVRSQPQPSTDGNMLALSLDKSESTLHLVPRGAGYDAIERLTLSLKTLRIIAAAEGKKPGRKMLIWIGPGWPMLDNPGYISSDATQRQAFNILVDTTRELRESRITMYSVNPVEPGSLMIADRYREFLKGVSSVKQIASGNLAVQVFAIHSGGRAFDQAADISREINDCVAEAKAYYTLGFDPPSAERTDEYHELEVKMDTPRVKARTNAGYYAEPALQH